MEVKHFVIKARAKSYSACAIQLGSHLDSYWGALLRAGLAMPEVSRGSAVVLYIPFLGDRAHVDATEWSSPDLQKTHLFISKEWDELPSGSEIVMSGTGARIIQVFKPTPDNDLPF